MLDRFKKLFSANPIEVSTNINCGSCVAKVKPFLDADSRIESWEVDTENPQKTLRVKGRINRSELEQILTSAGYRIKE